LRASNRPAVNLIFEAETIVSTLITIKKAKPRNDIISIIRRRGAI
jgi:hypothetical protein